MVRDTFFCCDSWMVQVSGSAGIIWHLIRHSIWPFSRQLRILPNQPWKPPKGILFRIAPPSFWQWCFPHLFLSLVAGAWVVVMLQLLALAVALLRSFNCLGALHSGHSEHSCTVSPAVPSSSVRQPAPILPHAVGQRSRQLLHAVVGPGGLGHRPDHRQAPAQGFHWKGLVDPWFGHFSKTMHYWPSYSAFPPSYSANIFFMQNAMPAKVTASQFSWPWNKRLWRTELNSQFCDFIYLFIYLLGILKQCKV